MMHADLASLYRTGDDLGSDGMAVHASDVYLSEHANALYSPL